MSKRLKNVIFFAIFVLILFLFTLTSLFSKEILWPDTGSFRQFTGIIFQNPANVENLVVKRSVVEDRGEELVHVDVEFTYTGEDSVARILGTPVRPLFFQSDVAPIYSRVKLKGDFDKVNNTLFQEKLKLRDFYNKSDNSDFKANSMVKLPLSSENGNYKFTLYYPFEELIYSDDRVVEQASVFLTNARVDDWQESTKKKESSKEAFSKSGYYVNRLEIAKDRLVTRITAVNTISTVLFILSTIVVLAMIWFGKNKFFFYFIPMLIIIPSFYRFLDFGASSTGVLLIYPLMAFIASIGAKMMSKPEDKPLDKKDAKQSLAFTFIYLILSLIIFILPRAF
ncbi:MAG: hypothetical protein Q4P25_03525 [Tissierellia bacterium]|nr:hypothetical protein [Tissierellia bacterium]